MACQAKAYRARKAADTGTAMSDRQTARRAAFHAGPGDRERVGRCGWETLDRYGADRPRVEAALKELCAELERRAGVEAPRDRDASFEPQLVKKRQRAGL